MSRIQPVSQPQPAAAQTLTTLHRNLGMVPNLYATLAHSPALLNGFLAFAEALGKGRLTAPQRELLALAIGQANACQYCLSAHTLLASKAGFSAQEIRAARLGQASAPLDHALLQLATALVNQRGVISDEQLASARAAGVDDELLLEVLGQVVVNTLTNYGNHLAATEIDFPPVTLTP
ncbi:carboxymuconolactone decarboxylase family protein [Aeromonas veronii]|uniref:carboxymuconolactone decarboxylase family protein n=1 Tax=Aeromonas veronii TaxID=654 RepID=UPI001F157C73|nr:carboxymuconolactone decarboxylase family protein [Aeromonas veronii]MCF5764822.1 carboxymuconolactone decarboxylase family protein [Aeromonas veronii]